MNDSGSVGYVLALARVGQDLGGLADDLTDANLRLETVGSLAPPGSTIKEVLEGAIRRASVVVVITATSFSSTQMFEAGVAAASGVPVIFAQGDEADQVAFPGTFTVRYLDGDRGALVAAILRHAPDVRHAFGPDRGQRAPKAVRASGSGRSVAEAGFDFEVWVAAQIRRTGAKVVEAAAGQPDKGFDLAVYSTQLEFITGLPLLIEVKLRLPSDLRRATAQLQASASRAGVDWVLVIYGDSDSDNQEPPDSPLPILWMSAAELADAEDENGFVRLVHEKRNLAAHGLSP